MRKYDKSIYQPHSLYALVKLPPFLLSMLAAHIPSKAFCQPANGLAPEITDLNAEDVSYQLEWQLPYLKEPFFNTQPQDLGDGIKVGKLGEDGGDVEALLHFARSLAKESDDPKTGKTDSFLIAYKGKLLFESYFRRGRVNYPHYQMSITKSYTALAIGRAIQLGHLSMEDLQKPVIRFLKDLDVGKLVDGADKITLHEAMNMCSGVRLPKANAAELMKEPGQLRGQGQIQSYLANSEPIPPAPREFKYQGADTAMTMQVLEAVVPGTAKDFIQKELFGKLGISSYNWQADLSGLPKGAAGSSVRSRDMLKVGILVMGNGKWKGEQLLPLEFVKIATSPINQRTDKVAYGYFWWVEPFEVGGKTYHSIQGRGAGGQFLFLFPELDLIAVVTSHNKGMGTLLRKLPQKIIPAFVK
jgi:CubicO group peptidase (beta-lactamase class C family)